MMNIILTVVCSMLFVFAQVIALVMDVFTDVDLFCDLLEASNKRKVPVYILLDEKNLQYFIDMCNALDIQQSHLNVSKSPFIIIVLCIMPLIITTFSDNTKKVVLICLHGKILWQQYVYIQLLESLSH